MDEKWRIELYENARGEKLVEEFFDSLEARTKLKINHAIELLETFGLEGGYPHVKKITGLILHGFKKKKQKTPTKEIKIAEERLEEYLIRKKQSN